MKFSDPFLRLKRSKFRRNIHLDRSDLKMVTELGLSRINQHAREVIKQKILVRGENDGKQTPYKGNPVFRAMHATGTCCRKCLFKWHRIPLYRELTGEEFEFVLNMIMRWIKKETLSHQSQLVF